MLRMCSLYASGYGYLSQRLRECRFGVLFFLKVVFDSGLQTTSLTDPPQAVAQEPTVGGDQVFSAHPQDLN